MSEFTYLLPFSEKTLLKGVANQLIKDGNQSWGSILLECEISLSDEGYSYYYSRKGRTRFNASAIVIKLSAKGATYDEL
jgi:hypothetical protein